MAAKAPTYKPGHVLEARTGGYLVKSRTTDGAWWLVFGATCSCPAGQKGMRRCWHRSQVEAFCRLLDAPMKRPAAPAAPASMMVD